MRSLIALCGLLLTAPAWAGSELTDAEFKALHKQLQPSLSEPWRTIPWRISVLEAQKVAAAEQKPLFIWAMDGHPLGCT